MAAIARMDLPTIIMIVLIGGAVISVVIYAINMMGGGKKSKRIDIVLNRRRGELAQQQTEDMNKPSAIRQNKDKNLAELAQKIYSALNLQSVLSTSELRVALAQAGMRRGSAVAVYMATRVIGAVAGFIAAVILIKMWKEFPYPPQAKFAFDGLGAVIGFYMPKVLLTNTAQKRQQAMTDGIPDTLDLMVICVEAGLSVEAAFARVTEEIMESFPVLAQEIGLTTAELAYLGDRRQAFENFATRTGLPAIKSLATTLIQTEQYGTPVGAALRVLADEKRLERMSIAEKKAAALPAKLSVPMIIFFLPLLFMVVIGPAIIQLNM